MSDHCKKYIDKEEIVRAIEIERKEKHVLDTAFDGLTIARSIVKFAKPADVKPVVHAHWIITEEKMVTMNGYVDWILGKTETQEPSTITRYTCSHCNYRTGIRAAEYVFCPNCGAEIITESTNDIQKEENNDANQPILPVQDSPANSGTERSV